MKNKKIEIFNTETGKWEPKAVTDEEYAEILKAEKNTSDVLQAEFEIVQRSIAMQMSNTTEKWSKD